MSDDELLAIARRVAKLTPKRKRTRASPAQKAKARRAAGGVCQGCGATTGLRVHHAVPASKGGTNRALQVLCKGCEKAAHRKWRIFTE